uniref:Chloride channel accessory 2 n=1 Tax=Sphenodon punctatus TaxID=8508 RepID=A0A8D0HKH2_SPHPU
RPLCLGVGGGGLTLALVVIGGSAVELQGNAYNGLLIAINPQVPEDEKIIPNIKEMITEASFYLFNATKRRVYFSNITILIPATWKTNNYGKPKQESYEKADVIVAAPYWKHGNDPYTLQYGECGEKGTYIHFTPKFLLKDRLIDIYGSRGRVFVHEWAHLRWGVFDEYDSERPFYISGQNQVKATRCSSDLTGIYVCEEKICAQGNCVINHVTGLFKEGCKFIHDKSQNASSSIMYMPSLSSVVEFCDASNHNTEAPNLQNKMCSYKSTWDTIMSSADFKSNFPMIGTSLPPPPIFSLLQSQDRVICLVLDVSSSMNEGDRINRLHQAAEVYLRQIVEENSYVGIVTFSHVAEVKTQLQQILSDDVRKNLASYLPRVATSGKTSVCTGLWLGFEVVKNRDAETSGSTIVLLTAGEDSSISNCFSEVKNSGSVIHIIALGSSAAKELEQLANMTGGLNFFATDRLDSNSLIDVFSGILSRSGDTSNQSVQIESAGESTGAYKHFNKTVTIDSTIGKNTFFVVTWQKNRLPDITLLDPSGKRYTNEDFEIDSGLHRAHLQIPEIAEAGDWTYVVTNTHNSSQVLTVAVTSRAVNSSIPLITVKAHTNKVVNFYPSPMIVYAQVSHGFGPILGANVTAIIEPEDGDPIILKLLDNGAGADVVKDDGVYSKYLFSFSGNGRYSLKLHVQQDNKTIRPHPPMPWSPAMYIPGYVENGKIQMNAPRPSVNEDDSQVRLGSFSRTVSGESFIVSSVPSGPYSDMFPPCKVIDFGARTEDNKIILSWTAPGDDFDQGQAASYDIRLSESPLELRDSFDNTASVNTSSLTPQHAGSKEIFLFEPETSAIENVTIIYVAIRAIDKVSQLSDISNIAQAVMFVPHKDSLTTSARYSVSTIVLIVSGLLTVFCVLISATACALKRKKKMSIEKTSTKLL